MLKSLEPDLNPDSIACDFELAAFTAIKDAFPNVQIFGCYFHLCQNFRSKLGELHLLSRYKNEPEFTIHAKSIIALAFVPISDLDDALDILSENLLQYFIILFILKIIFKNILFLSPNQRRRNGSAENICRRNSSAEKS